MAINFKQAELICDALAPVIRDTIDQAIAPLRKRIDSLERQEKGFKYMGIHQRACEYSKGNVVTVNGSIYIALRDTSAKPGDGDSWQLMLKGGH